MLRLADKVALVTGGARGIGRAIVEKFLAEGAAVSFIDIDVAAGHETCAALAAGLPSPSASAPGAATRAVAFLPADVTVEGDVAGAVESVIDAHGRIDVLVNNAGVNAYADATELTEAQWDAFFAVDLKSAWLCAKHVLPGMKARRAGSIVNISSIHATLSIPGMFPYPAAKAGLVGLTRSLALDFAALGIRVNAVAPGYTRTHLVDEWLARQPDPADAEADVLRVLPMRRIATPMEVANVVAFIASDEASAVTGASIAVDGGLGARFAT